MIMMITTIIIIITDIQNIWIIVEIPQNWTTVLIHPIHKKGDKTDVDNWAFLFY